MKTTFSSGVIVTSQWLNGAKQIFFDGADLDWHYNPLGLNSLVASGPNGLDSRYITLGTDQPTLDSTGLLVSGTPISGSKVVTGAWNFGYNPVVTGNPPNIIVNAPKSYTTNSKYNFANGVVNPTIAQRFAALQDEDLVTKLILEEHVLEPLDNLEIDNGIYYSGTSPACENYNGGSDTVCPL